MPKYQVVPFIADHLTRIQDVRSEKAVILSVGGLSGAYGQMLQAGGPAFTGISDDGEIIACGGLYVLWDGVAKGWMITAELANRFQIALHRQASIFFAGIPPLVKIKRLEADVDAAFRNGIKWLERLGFDYESTMMRRGPNAENYLRYVRFYP